MTTLEEPSDQPPAASPHGPVFVDASGRRLRRVKLIGLGALGLVAGYVVLLLVAFISGSNAAAPYLPFPAAAEGPVLPSSPSAPASTMAVRPIGEAPSAEPAVPVRVPVAAVQDPVTVAVTVPAAPPVNSPADEAGARAAAPAPAAEAAAPGMSGSAPGQATRPSAPPRP